MDKPVYIFVQKEENRAVNTLRIVCGALLASILYMRAVDTYKGFKKKYKGE